MKFIFQDVKMDNNISYLVPLSLLIIVMITSDVYEVITKMLALIIIQFMIYINILIEYYKE